MRFVDGDEAEAKALDLLPDFPVGQLLRGHEQELDGATSGRSERLVSLPLRLCRADSGRSRVSSGNLEALDLIALQGEQR